MKISCTAVCKTVFIFFLVNSGLHWSCQCSLYAQTLKIMPLGDSITYDSYTGDPRPTELKTGYRQPLWLSLADSGNFVDFVGSKVVGADAVPAFDPDNAGFPGYSTSQLADLLEADPPYLDSYQPDIVLLHIGTNNLQVNVTGVERILDTIDAYSTSAHVVIARIINQAPCCNSTVTAFNVEVETLVNNRKLAGDRLTLVDMEDGAGLDYIIDDTEPFEHDMIDYLHPNARGYTKMAEVWFDALMTLLNIFVEPGGSCGGFSSCFDSIQQAIDEAPPTATIRVGAGTYPETVIIDKAVTLEFTWKIDFTILNPKNPAIISGPAPPP
jgi:lysophospholipase L1-like esterase